MDITRFVITLFFLAVGLAVAGTSAFADSRSEGQIGNPGSFFRDILSSTFEYGPEDLAVPIGTIYQGCPARDCIPSIDDPEYLPAKEVEFLHDDDIVLAVSYEGITRAYPTKILDRHEIANTWFGDEPILVTWCPLCGSGLAFYRALDGKAVEFGVSGLLHNSDLVMYDRVSGSLWPQITGKAIAGPKRGEQLAAIPSTMTRWSDWKSAHPSGQVLKPPRSKYLYEGSPYRDYLNSDRLMFPVTRQDARLKPKRVVYGIEVEGQPIAVDAEWLSEVKRWRHETGNGALIVELNEAGGAVGTLDGEPIPVHRMFWFAWYSFNPDTAVIDESATSLPADASLD